MDKQQTTEEQAIRWKSRQSFDTCLQSIAGKSMALAWAGRGCRPCCWRKWSTTGGNAAASGAESAWPYSGQGWEAHRMTSSLCCESFALASWGCLWSAAHC